MAGATLTFTVLGKNKASPALKQVGDDADRLSTKLGKAIKPAASFTATAASLTSVAIPASIGLAKLAVAGAQLAASMAPAAASLPAVAGGLLFLQKTVVSTGPAMAKAFDPVTKAFTDGQKSVDKLATKGLPSLARQFVKVNFPAIHEAMEEIAMTQNEIVKGVGKWVNSAHGQELIRNTFQGISSAVAELRPELTGVVISFLELARRGGTQGIEALATGLQRAAVWAKKFMDGISVEDISRAWGAVEGFGSKLAAFGHVVLDVGNWLNENKDKAAGFSDALAGVGIALGILSGSPIGVLVGGLTLLVNHWDEVKAAVSGAVEWFRTSEGATSAVSGVMSTLRGVVADLSSWWNDSLLPALEKAGREILPALTSAAQQVAQAFRDNKDAVDKARGIFDAVGVIITGAVIPAISVLARTLIPLLTDQFTSLIDAINSYVLPGIRIFVKLALDQFGAIINGADAAFGWIPGIGPKLHAAAVDFNSFRSEVNAALDGIRDRNVTVTARFRAVGDVGIVTGNGTASGALKVQARAAGGPVLKGRSYLVGEKGPELFSPGLTGRITSTPQTQALMQRPGGGAAGGRRGGDTNVTVIVQGSTLASRTEIETAVLRALESARAKGRRV